LFIRGFIRLYKGFIRDRMGLGLDLMWDLLWDLSNAKPASPMDDKWDFWSNGK
jgi:hypothetical protein